MNRTAHICIGVATLTVMGLAAVPLIWGSNQAVGTMFNAPLRWIARDSPARTQFNAFLDQFDSHEMVLVSWPGCTVEDQRLQQLARALEQRRDERAAAGRAALYSEILTGHTLLEQLTQPPASLSRTVALRRMEGTLVGADLRTSCAVIVFTDEGALRRREAVAEILWTAERVTGHPREALYVAGPPLDGIAIDDESSRSINRYAVPSAVISLVLCCLCLRSAWMTLPILFSGAIGQAAMLAAVYYGGMTLNAILIVLPPLVFVLTVSAGVHLVNYFTDEMRTGPPAGAITRAIRKAWGPCMLAAITTAIGLCSLAVSRVQPVRQFGALAAPGVVLCVILLFLLLPGAMELWPRWRRQQREPRPREVNAPRVSPRSDRLVVRLLQPWATSVSALAVGLLILCGAGLTQLRTSLNVVALLSEDNRAARDFHWFQQHIGPLVPVEVVVEFGPDGYEDPLERLAIVRAVQAKVGAVEGVGGAMSAATFFPSIPRGRSLRDTGRRGILRRMVEQRRQELIDAHFLAVGARKEAWRIAARVYGRGEVDYGRFLEQIRRQVDPFIEQLGAAGRGPLTASYTGVTPVVYEVQRALLADLFSSFLVALALVTVVMIVALRSVRSGLIAMVPNVFPSFILFGAMGWMDRAIDIGTVMTASVALGMAVDGTFHFLKWFRFETEQGESRTVSVGYAYRHCGRALIQTTIICASGMLVYTLSGFLPARNFAWMLLLLLVLALVGDLVVLPALLLSPLGRLFVLPAARQHQPECSHEFAEKPSSPATAQNPSVSAQPTEQTEIPT